MDTGIYKIESPSGGIYIGQSKNLRERIDRYDEVEKVKPQILIYRSLKKYGYKNHKIEILIEGDFTREELNLLEKYYVKKYNSYRGWNKKGLNLTTGGNQPIFDESIRKKMSDTRKRLFAEGQRNSKLSVEQVIEIKKLLAYRTSCKELGVKFNVKNTTINQIKNHHTWKDIPDYVVPDNEKHLVSNFDPRVVGNVKYSDELLKEIIADYKSGMKQFEIVKKYKMNKGTISGLLNKRFSAYLWN